MSLSKISKQTVNTALPQSKRYTIFDTEVRGFGLRIFPSGKKSWVFEYRAGAGGRGVHKKRVTFGTSTDFTPNQARKHAELLRLKTRTGEDPQAEKLKSRAAPTLSEVAKIFLEEQVRPKLATKTLAQYEFILNRIVLPKLGNIKAKDVSRAEITKLQLAWSKKPYQANRMCAVLSSMYGFASKYGLVPEKFNPAHGIVRFKETASQRYLSGDELQKLGMAIREAETTGLPMEIDSTKKSKHIRKTKTTTVYDEHVIAAFRLLLFTGARLREILDLKWEYVDLEKGVLFLPKSKTGQKIIILNTAAIDILAKLTRIGIYVIASNSAGMIDEKPRTDLKKPWAKLKKHSGLENVRLHDLRHSFGATGASEGLGLPIIGKLMGHSQPATTQRYAHLADAPLRSASNAIGDHISAAMGDAVEMDG